MKFIQTLFTLSLLLTTLTGCSHLSYIIQAGRGQLALYNSERKIEDVIKDPSVLDITKEQLKWLGEIKTYVEQVLGVKPTSNYTTYVELHRKYVIWSLTQASPFELKVKEWSFPIVGTFPYLGFFTEKMANEWAEKAQKNGEDTYVRGVTAYSTLGYFRDPLLSSMLTGQRRDLVNLIFHESTHTHLYVKDHVDFNEQVASFIGDYGELEYLKKTFGVKSTEVLYWNAEREDRRQFGSMLREFAERLKKLYLESAALPDSEKVLRKKQEFENFQKSLVEQKWKSLNDKTENNWFSRVAKKMTNNAVLLAYLTYEDDQDIFDLLYERCNRDVKKSFEYLLDFAKYFESLPNKDKVKPQDVLRARLK